jgi:phosphate:Na+ symporter
MDYAGIIVGFLGSLGIFLFGLSVLSKALQKAAGSKMKQLLGTMSKTRFRGVLFGAGVTALMQSSTATTVMTIGFVNAGIISLTQIVGIIMGANIGNTAASWLISSYEWSNFLKPDAIGAVCASGGALALLFSKKESVKNIASVIIGFGLLFIGLSSMPVAMRPLAEQDVVRNLFITLGGSPLLALLVGIVVTGVIQSSTASIGILQSMAITGMIPWSAAVFIVLGQNVGTCFTTMLTSIGANRNTRAAAFVHFVYNAVGAVIFSIGAFVFFTFINPSLGGMAISSTNIATIHTGYNVLLLLILFPLGGFILRMAVRMAGEEKPVLAGKCELTELDESILETPEYALENSVKAVHKLTEVLRAKLIAAKEIIKKPSSSTSFWAEIDEADKANKAIRYFLTKLHNEKISETENLFIVVLLQNLTSLQRISNHAKGIVKEIEKLQSEGVAYSESIDAIISDIGERMAACYDEAVTALATRKAEHVERAVLGAETVQGMREAYKSSHFVRVSNGVHDIQSDIRLMEVVRHMSRIVSHAKSIAETVLVEDDPLIGRH